MDEYLAHFRVLENALADCEHLLLHMPIELRFGLLGWRRPVTTLRRLDCYAAAMPTMGLLSGEPPWEPWNTASP